MAKQRSLLGEIGTWLRKWERRPGWTYYAVCHHPFKCDVANPNHRCTEVMGYGGQTRRNPETRWSEHQNGGGAFNLEAKDWGDTIIRWETHRHGKRISGFKLDRWERRLIIRGVKGLGRPFYNVEWNKLNPDRIKPWEAKEQRRMRDAARARRPSAARAAMVLATQLERNLAGYIAGIKVRRGANDEVLNGTWYGDRGADFRRDFLAATRKQGKP